MKPAPAAPVRRLVPLGVAVLAVHLALLDRPWRERVAPRPAPKASFTIRTIVPPAPVPAPVPAPPMPPQAQAPPDPVTIRPHPRPPKSTPAHAQAKIAAAPAATSPPPAVAPPSIQPLPPAHLHYELLVNSHGLAYAGESSLAWRHDGAAYALELELRNPLWGTRWQRSEGRIGEEGLQPEHFHDKTRGEQATHFDREQGRVSYSNNRPDAPLAAGMQDRLSVVLQVAMLVAAAPARYPPGTQIAIPTTTTREADTWVFTVLGEEALELPGGAVRALKLQRLPGRQYDVQLDLWLAPGMDYAPVRLRLTNPNGDTVDQRWSSTDKG